MKERADIRGLDGRPVVASQVQVVRRVVDHCQRVVVAEYYVLALHEHCEPRRSDRIIGNTKQLCVGHCQLLERFRHNNPELDADGLSVSQDAIDLTVLTHVAELSDVYL